MTPPPGSFYRRTKLFTCGGNRIHVNGMETRYSTTELRKLVPMPRIELGSGL
jgi:hypothetical protein